MSDTDNTQADVEAQDFDFEQGGQGFEPSSDDLAEVANQLNAQIADILGDFGVDALTETDPEYGGFMKVVRSSIASGNGAAILRAAAQAGKAKAARLANEQKPVKSSWDYAKRLRDERQSAAVEPEYDPADDGITGHYAEAVNAMAAANVYIEEGDPEFSIVKPFLDNPNPGRGLVEATRQAIAAKQARTFTGHDYMKLVATERRAKQ